MRVALDARTVYSPTRRGTGKNLVDLYTRLARTRRDWTFLMFHRDPDPAHDPFRAEPNVESRLIEIRGDRWDLWEHVRLPAAAAQARASVLHAPANMGPHLPIVPLVVTIHDLIPLDVVEHPEITRRWMNRVGRGARQARRILTPSAFTKGRLVQHFGVAAEKVIVNQWAPDSTCVRVEDPVAVERVRARYGLAPGQHYVFGFGASDPRKNTRRIIEAWAGLPGGVRDELGLLLVGLQEPALTESRALLSALVPGGGWSLMGFADEADLPALMTGATALCYPSLSEGFGLPILDAFACATPVITSCTTSLPEVAGDAAILVEPSSVEAIRQAMFDVGTRPELAASLRARGAARLQLFSWDRCAETAAGVLVEAA